jgi:hypothetical protein
LRIIFLSNILNAFSSVTVKVHVEKGSTINENKYFIRKGSVIAFTFIFLKGELKRDYLTLHEELLDDKTKFYQQFRLTKSPLLFVTDNSKCSDETEVSNLN